MDDVTADLVVCGAGSAGASCAVAAARRGLNVLLVERYGFAGGTGAQVLDTFYGFFTPGPRPRRVVGGVGWEVVSALQAWGAAIERPNTYGAGIGITYNPEVLKLVWDELLTAAGVQVLFHRLVTDAQVRAGHIERILTHGKGGPLWLRARAFVDATGDADLAALAGVPFDEQHLAERTVQSLTTTFRLANVDVERARAVTGPELWRRMEQASQEGYDLPRREGSAHPTPVPGVMATNMTRVARVNPLDPFELSRAEREGRRQAVAYYRFLRDRVPGYERADLIFLSTQIGVRESRRIHGLYTLTAEDVLSARQFADAVALCGAPIEEHHAGTGTRWRYLPEGAVYGIPWRCLVPQAVDNLVVAGRCLSATHDAHASVRSMAQCLAMGHAAGTGISLALSAGVPPADVPADRLRQALRAEGAILGEGDA